MSTKTTLIVSISLVLLATVVGLALWPNLPELMASHWNIQNEVDGYMTRFWGVLLTPAVAMVMIGLFLLVPSIDPLKENIAKFRPTFNAFIVFIITFLVYLHMLTLIYNLGYTFSMSTAMLPGTGGLFYFAGVLTSQAKRNFFIGIRTPWTLSSDTVWDATHRLGGVLFKVAGLLTILGAFAGKYAFWFIFIPLIAAALIPIVYSYILFQREVHLERDS